ncbi:MAG: hypothetical protein JF612_11790, partial [Planctomycetia bacterium]|nr:hypothetical protein [Planctomycetia bacterium]
TSEIYQAITPTFDDKAATGGRGSGESDDYVFRGPLPRRMTAEQFVDAVWQVTGAAPIRPDAHVVRAKLSSEPSPLTAHHSLHAKWIWSDAEAAKAPAGQTITFRHQFKLPAAPSKAVAVITCDNEHRLIVNGQQIAADDNWESVELVPLEPYLKAGNNEILIVGKNAGRGPNAAGLIFEALIKTPDGKETTVATSGEWRWTSIQPDARGRFKDQPSDWQAAVEITPAAVWTNRVGSVLPAMLHQAASGPTRMVRAALVRSDGLMRSLGRPNRDQIPTATKSSRCVPRT